MRAWFEAPLSTSATRNDHNFMHNMLKYHQTHHIRAFTVLQSCYRYLWYLIPQTVVFTLADPGLCTKVKENMAKKLHSLERREIPSGDPVFPSVD